ncbi:hypothetical protein SSP24_79080 [Streptomyces spinoverrucosus]|uniref:Integrase catalytic domain-containing protein n=1 Tax=Streptomyces spinoverrucosus TaxID=284043 RepID=A0A4Y3VUC7_9ACTN|nr:hypothetical protein SSP24_79080 [Streptomyces spinoverrucosus]GHB97903.1 hypothetical protein GCM10010397_83060 [Streptomyces spinoverrucosus]
MSAGAGGGVRLLAVDHGEDAAEQDRGRFDRRALTAADRPGSRSQGSCLGQRGSRGVLAGRQGAADGGLRRVRGLLGIRVIQCRPGDPEAKGLVERANGYLETSFLPGRIFASPTDFNIQLADWLVKANRRIHRTLQARPADRIETDKARMLPLPPVDPPGWWRTSLRLPRDHYVRVDTNDYSVHPLAIGRRIEVKADLDQVLAFLRGHRGRPACPLLGPSPVHHRPDPRGRREGRPRTGPATARCCRPTRGRAAALGHL